MLNAFWKLSQDGVNQFLEGLCGQFAIISIVNIWIITLSRAHPCPNGFIASYYKTFCVAMLFQCAWQTFLFSRKYQVCLF